MREIILVYGGTPERSFIMDANTKKYIRLIQKFSLVIVPDAIEVTIDAIEHDFEGGIVILPRGVDLTQTSNIKCKLVSIISRDEYDKLYALAGGYPDFIPVEVI